MPKDTSSGDGFSFLETFTIPTIVDSPEIPTPEEPKAPVVTEPAAEPKVETPAEPPITGTAWSNMLRLMKEQAKVEIDDAEITDDLGPEGLMEKLIKAAEIKVLADNPDKLEALRNAELNKLAERGHTQDQLERALYYSEHLALGGSEDVVTRHAYLDALATADLESEEDELEVFRRLQTLRGQDPGFVEDHIAKELTGEANAEKRKAAAEKAQDDLGRLRDYEMEQDKLRAKQVRDGSEQAKRKERETFERVIDTGFGGIKLQKEESEKLKKAMFTVSHWDSVRTPDGGVTKIPKTEETKALEAIFADPEKRVTLAYLAIFGLDSLAGKETTNRNNKLIKAIEQSAVPPSNVLHAPAPADMKLKDRMPDNTFIISV